jgi:hypothetical protein
MLKRMIATALALLFAASGASAGGPELRTNKTLFDEACRDAGRDLAAASGLTPASSVLVRFAGGERTEFFRAPLMDAIASASRTVYTSGTAADTAVTFSVENAAVAYGSAFREGFLRERMAERAVSIDVRIEAVSVSTGRVLHVETVQRTVRDTIAVDDIAEAGASTRRIAAGEGPGPSFWERILEPAILTVSSGIAVYLFFTVRS